MRGEELAGEKERGEENKEENLLTFLPENQGAFSYNAYSRNCSFQYSVLTSIQFVNQSYRILKASGEFPNHRFNRREREWEGASSKTFAPQPKNWCPTTIAKTWLRA